MANYKDLVGTAIRNNAGNIPTAETGQVFYDSTNVDFKYQFPAVADAWRTSAPMNTASWTRVTCGSVTSALANSGEQTPPQGTAFFTFTETWNGTSWTEVADTSYKHYGGNGSHGVPNNTAALVFAGYSPSDHGYTEEWNGSSWTELSDVNTVRRFGGGNGTTAEACLYYGGLVPSTSYDNTESWNGSSWTEVADINTARYGTNGIGSSTSAAYVGGALYPGPQPPGSFHEQWNGSTWTEATDANQKTHGAGSGVVNTAMLIFGGNPTGYTERWNGSTWTETTDLNEARDSQGGTGAGGSTSALSVGGVPPGGQPNGSASVEEFVGSQPIGAFSSAPNLNTARANIAGIGISTSALAVGGRSPVIASNEQYDGTSWTEVGDLNTARHSGAPSGTTTSGLVSGGETSTAFVGIVEEWSGSAWTEVADLNTTRGEGGGAGASAEAALVYGGGPGNLAVTESWNGSAWTEVADLNTGIIQSTLGLGRTYTAALAVGGRNPPTSYLSKTEVWNGTAWTEGANLNTGRASAGGQTGSSTSAQAIGGYTGTAYTAANENWNGISWQETADLSTGRSGSGGAGADSTSILAYGGFTPSVTAATEEWSGSSNTIKVLTD